MIFDTVHCYIAYFNSVFFTACGWVGNKTFESFLLNYWDLLGSFLGAFPGSTLFFFGVNLNALTIKCLTLFASPYFFHCHHFSFFSWLKSSCLTNSCTGTSSAFAIAMRASRLGWVVLVPHLDTVAGSLPSLSDSHLLFRSRSARTTLIRFNFAMIDNYLTAKLQKLIVIYAEIFNNRLQSSKNLRKTPIFWYFQGNYHAYK